MELSYKNVEELYRGVLAEAREGTFCKLDMWGFTIHYRDGTVSDVPMKYVGDKGH